MDHYLLQIWNPVTETWTDSEPWPDSAEDWFQEDPENRRVLDLETRAIVFQPED